MILFRRCAVLLVPVVLGLLLALPGRAQQPASSARFAFADTTLLRDTLDLKFDELFPLADSLQMLPDTLRALSIRYRLPLRRLLHIADSMAVTVDSVGAVLERERFNPLAAAGQTPTTFRYTTGYNIQQTATVWTNGSDWSRTGRVLFMRNATNIEMDRYNQGGTTSLRQTRSSDTEAGWKFSPDLSAGARARLDRFLSDFTGGVNNENSSRDEITASLRTRHQPFRTMTTELNFFPGLLNESRSQYIKRGWSGDLNGRVRWTAGNWFANDLNGELTGNLARTRLPNSEQALDTRDHSQNLNGTLGLFANSPIGANLNYRLRGSVVATPLDSGRVQEVRNVNNGADLTLRGRLDSDRYLNLIGHYGTGEQAQSNNLSQLSTRRELSFSMDGRYTLASFLIDARFSNGTTNSDFPHRAATGGYGEDAHARSIGGTVTRFIGRRLVIKGTGQVDLTSYRYTPIGTYDTSPVDRDQYRQNYHLDGQYTVSQDLNSAVALDVTRTLAINIPATATGSNNEDHAYRAEWRWNYRLFRDLTVTQQNAITADYLYYTYRHKDDRLSLIYTTNTTLNAVLSPRFTLVLTHRLTYQPSGNYTLQPDGLEAFRRSDETRNYGLTAQIQYTPTPAVSFTISPDYYASRFSNSAGGQLAPQRRDRSLNLSGGANLNLALGKRGKLTGTINRSYRSSGSLVWTQGTPVDQPGVAQDYWNGTLQLSWEL